MSEGDVEELYSRSRYGMLISINVIIGNCETRFHEFAIMN